MCLARDGIDDEELRRLIVTVPGRGLRLNALGKVVVVGYTVKADIASTGT